MTSAPYAAHQATSRGRRFAEQPSCYRSEYQRDRDRIIHSRAFRRLMHKTQVFATVHGDHHRTRMTHSLEVAQIARTIARSLALDEDLAEAIALAHDLGHTPFGHIGEEVLDEAMAQWGGFSHNIQTFRILTRLESPYAAFDGLNLTWETLEGVVKHNGPMLSAVPPAIANYNRLQDLEVDSFPGVEAQVASLADDIAYNGHDLDDGLRMGLFTLDDLAGAPVAAEAILEVRERWPDAPLVRKIHETMRKIIDVQVRNLVETSRATLVFVRPQSADDVRWHDTPVIGFSETFADAAAGLKAWLYTNMYCHERLRGQAREAATILRGLFSAFRDDPQRLPVEWKEHLDRCGEADRMRLVADYLAGMTDRFAHKEHQRLVRQEP
ncbi:MAG: deoxyguanosinetriphosphate triphosphohydrolase [bacterium]|nr:deoxyguanosinetriphosphate triphosphohydrolase [bacterium]MDE0242331.1 deoxyguanosinetriphosphate triphosphohydrolase [bacterium]MDE0417496.1 deoxyguanosinetriphosphate triphosphohydrolase [bacterium]